MTNSYSISLKAGRVVEVTVLDVYGWSMTGRVARKVASRAATGPLVCSSCE